MPIRAILIVLSLFSAVATTSAKTHLPTTRAATRPTTQPSIVLKAADAKLTGGVMKLVFDKESEICYWTDVNAKVQWPLTVPQVGKYNVEVIMSCDADHGGKFTVSVGTAQLADKTRDTTGWHHYFALYVGTIQIDKAESTLTIVPVAPIRGQLMNVRAVRLTPAS